MFAFPKLVVLILVFAAVWIAYRWVNGQARNPPPRPPASRRRVIEAEDLSACAVCGAYVAAGAPRCARADCPRQR